VESSEIDLSEFQEPNTEDATGNGDQNDNNGDADVKVGNSTLKSYI